MTDLFHHLVTRSAGRPTPSGSIPHFAEEREAETLAPRVTAGEIRPRLRSRHEQMPEFEPIATETPSFGEARDSAAFAEIEPTGLLSDSDALGRRAAIRRERSFDGRLGARESRERAPDRRAAAELAGDGTHASGALQTKLAFRPVIAAEPAGVAPKVEIGAPQGVSPATAEEAETRLQPAPRQPTQELAPRLSRRAEPQPPAREPVGRIIPRPTMSLPRQPGEESSSAAAEPTLVRRASVLRNSPPRPMAATLPPGAERPLPPRIEIRIGRIEVRAEYALSVSARKAVPTLRTSLDDYLKQRDRPG